MKKKSGILIPVTFINFVNHLDKSTIILCMYLFEYFTDIDYNPDGSKVSTLSKLCQELKLSRNTVIRALDTIKEKGLFIVENKNCFPRTVIITLVSYPKHDN